MYMYHESFTSYVCYFVNTLYVGRAEDICFCLIACITSKKPYSVPTLSTIIWTPPTYLTRIFFLMSLFWLTTMGA
jgi:hypothetical protein